MVRRGKKKIDKLVLILLVVLFVAINYSFLDKALVNLFEDYEVGVVERVIDGDTVVVNGTSVRLLGINTPEKGELYYNEAKEFLENITLGSLVRMEKGKEDLDLYNRKLRYIYLEGENINIKLVENGYANYYFPSGKDRYYNEFREAWENCLIKGENLCKTSEEMCASCIEITEWDYKKEIVELENTCNFYCELTNWTIKDEGRKVFTFPSFVLKDSVIIETGEGEDTQETLFWKGENYVWTETGDSLFLRDNNGKLVLWQSY